jgi:hypothetical protein
MRFAPVFLLWLLAAVVLGQTAPAQSLFRTTKFEATVVVRKHSTGADLVEVTVLKPHYSHTLLRKQIELLAKEVGSAPRGLQIFDYRIDPADTGPALVKASFAVDGLIDREHGVLRLQPIARGFSLAEPPDALDALMVQFEGERPTENTIRACSPPAPGCTSVILEGRAADARYGIEYRLKLLSHDPTQISIPDFKQDAPAAKPTPPTARTDWLLIGLLFVAALAVGALVYSLLSRGRPGARA